ncbi:MAG: hypothetical protein R6V03_03565 [Kiritimatiellia bacterium]
MSQVRVLPGVLRSGRVVLPGVLRSGRVVLPGEMECQKFHEKRM